MFSLLDPLNLLDNHAYPAVISMIDLGTEIKSQIIFFPNIIN